MNAAMESLLLVAVISSRSIVAIIWPVLKSLNLLNSSRMQMSDVKIWILRILLVYASISLFDAVIDVVKPGNDSLELCCI